MPGAITSHQARLTALLTLLSPKAKILELGRGAGGDTNKLERSVP